MVMKNSQKILPFPKPPEDPGAQTIIFQIGNERFAIHYEMRICLQRRRFYSGSNGRKRPCLKP